jgi:hypothetical protein
MTVTVAQIADLLCLVYHEARYVRVLARIENASRYARLTRLPQERDAAWRELSGTRKYAGQSKTAENAALVFAKRLRVSLDDLVLLYENPLWVGRNVGGPNWAALTSKVRELIQVKTAGDAAQVDRLYQEILGLRHNTGTVQQKLTRLNSSSWAN